jgi:hypothetical protein
VSRDEQIGEALDELIEAHDDFMAMRSLASMEAAKRRRDEAVEKLAALRSDTAQPDEPRIDVCTDEASLRQLYQRAHLIDEGSFVAWYRRMFGAAQPREQWVTEMLSLAHNLRAEYDEGDSEFGQQPNGAPDSLNAIIARLEEMDAPRWLDGSQPSAQPGDTQPCQCDTNAAMHLEGRRWTCSECGGHVCYEGELRNSEAMQSTDPTTAEGA